MPASRFPAFEQSRRPLTHRKLSVEIVGLADRPQLFETALVKARSGIKLSIGVGQEAILEWPGICTRGKSN